MFSSREQARYDRHFILPGFGMEGQARLKRSSVLCIGAGGLGSPAALYLAAAGVGRIGILDDDRVDLSNLQRQILHGESALGQPKTASARERLTDLNGDIEIEPLAMRLTADNVLEVFSGRKVLSGKQFLTGVSGRAGRFRGSGGVRTAGALRCPGPGRM